ncbi:hypothetical protein F5Y12DRAFT_720500 [Xylaria sp. FL1777]|nr:hypothetical protein F5Y12DRAFT_720500 [Xylaria sp. FL1777]
MAQDRLWVNVRLTVIWSLKLSWSKEIGVSLVFAVGLLGVTAALIRVILAAQFVSAADQVYFVSQVGLLALTEITTGFLVLCTPSIPKAFDTMASTSGFVSLRSWYFRYKDSKLSHGSPVSHDTEISAESKSGLYQQVDERSLIALTEMERSKLGIIKDRGGITREVQFTATAEFSSHADSADEQYKSQHPWTRDVV